MEYLVFLILPFLVGAWTFLAIGILSTKSDVLHNGEKLTIELVISNFRHSTKVSMLLFDLMLIVAMIGILMIYFSPKGISP